MKLIKPIALTIVALTTLSCASNKMKTVVGDINQGIVSYKKYKGKCPTCPNYTIKVYPDRNFVFNGIENVEPIGEKSRVLSKSEYKAIVKEFEQNHFFYLQNEYLSNTMDLAVSNLFYNGKAVRFQEKECPEKLKGVVSKIENLNVE